MDGCTEEAKAVYWMPGAHRSQRVFAWCEECFNEYFLDCNHKCITMEPGKVANKGKL